MTGPAALKREMAVTLNDTLEMRKTLSSAIAPSTVQFH